MFTFQFLERGLHSLKWTLFLLTLPLTTSSQHMKIPGAENSINIPQTEDFAISGTGENERWKNTSWISLIQRKGDQIFSTRAKLMYSKKGIYVLFSCEDQKITSTLEKDFTNLYTEDVVEIFFWPHEKDSLYFEYEISPNNFELPILVPNHQGTFFGWLPWHYEGGRKTIHKTSIERKGNNGKVQSWTAEIFIPFALLRPLQNVPPSKGTYWRVNLYRIDYDESPPSQWTWQPVKSTFHDIKHFGYLFFN